MNRAIDVLVLDGHVGHTARVLQALSWAGGWRLHVLTCTATIDRMVMRSRHLASVRHLGPTTSESDVIAGIVAAVGESRAQVILPLSEPLTLACIRHRTALTAVAHLPPLPSADAFNSAVDKASLSATLRQHGLPTPRTWVHEAGSPLPVAETEMPFPLIIKPSRGDFGAGIMRADDVAALDRALERFGPAARFVIQERLTGADIDCSVLARDGEILAWTIQEALRPPEREFAPASELRFVDHAPTLDVVRRLMRALQWSGIAHIDLRLEASTGRPCVLEINGRYWGSLLGSVAAGVNFPDLACRAALGLPLGSTIQRPIRFTSQGLGFKSILCHLLGRRNGFRYSETPLPFLLRDPLPTLLHEFGTRLRRRR